MSTAVISKTVPVPTYLSCFEKDFQDILLIYAKKPSVPSDDGNSIKTEPIDENSTIEDIEECDLTGDPLKVDLGEDEMFEINTVDHAVSIWSQEETRHFPLSVTEARREINNITTIPEPDLNGLPIYAVCNGDDSRNTILLGAHRKTLMASSVYALGFLELKDDEIGTDEMVNDHYHNCNRKDIEVKYLVNIRYNVYGKPLRNVKCQDSSMRNSEKHASCSVEVVSHQPVFKVLEDTKLNMTMNLELVAGHKLLRVYSLWEEMRILQTLIDILLDSNFGLNEDSILCDDPLDSDIILERISLIVKTKFLRPPPKKDILDLDNLRQEDFLDGLWDILNKCESASVLRDSFQFLFEELADGDIQVINIKDKYTSIAFIINGILSKNIVLSALTLSQCVELLFELGAQKVKFDFQVILDYFHYMAKSDIESVWKNLNQPEEQKSRNTKRHTKVTQHLITSNLVSKSRQLAYLCQLYIASEFIFLVKEQVYLQTDSFYSFCQHVERQYVQNANVVEDFLEIYQRPLCETSCAFDMTNLEVIKSVSPSRWTMYMNSEVGSTQVTTIYDVSECPVFPPAIYNYAVPITTENMFYHMYKMVRRQEL